MASSRGSSRPRDQTHVSYIGRQMLDPQAAQGRNLCRFSLDTSLSKTQLTIHSFKHHTHTHTHTHTHGLGSLSLPRRGSGATRRSSRFRKPGSGFQRLRQGLGEAGGGGGEERLAGVGEGVWAGGTRIPADSHMKATQIRAVFYPDVRQRRRGLFCLSCIRLAPHHARSCPQMLTSAGRGPAGPLCLPLGANANLRG